MCVCEIRDRAMKQALKRSALAPVVAAAALPLALLEAASGLVSLVFIFLSFVELWGLVFGTNYGFTVSFFCQRGRV